MASILETAKKSPDELLLDASGSGEVNGIVDAVRAGADVNCCNRKGFTPLHWACSENRGPAVTILLGLGADPRALDHISRAPMHYAAWHGGDEAVRAMAEGGAELFPESKNLVRVEGGELPAYPLTLALDSGRVDTVTALMEFCDPLSPQIEVILETLESCGNIPKAWSEPLGVLVAARERVLLDGVSAKGGAGRAKPRV